MAFQLRRLKKNVFGTGTGVMLIVVPFIVSALLAVTFVPMGNDVGLSQLGLYNPENFDDMTPQQRDNWLVDTHGNWRLELRTWMGIPHTILTDWAGTWWLIFDDGFEMKQSDWKIWREGGSIDISYVDVTMSILSLNPPALGYVGDYGAIVRIVMIFSLCIGLVDILWFG